MARKYGLYKCCRCLKAFGHRTNSNNLFCSRECAFAFMNETGITPMGVAKVRSRTFTIGWCSCGEVTVNRVDCQSCESASKKRRRESNSNRAYFTKRGRTRGVCVDCGKASGMHESGYAKRWCDDCHLAREREVSWMDKHFRRAKEHGVNRERVDRRKVFAAYEWTCGICGQKTDATLLGTSEANAPTVDHIIPMSKGGPHTYENVQCACHRCNTLKSNSDMAPVFKPLPLAIMCHT